MTEGKQFSQQSKKTHCGFQVWYLLSEKYSEGIYTYGCQEERPFILLLPHFVHFITNCSSNMELKFPLVLFQQLVKLYPSVP